MSLAGVFMRPKGESTKLRGSEDWGCPVWVTLDMSGFIRHVRASFQQDFEVDKCIP